MTLNKSKLTIKAYNSELLEEAMKKMDGNQAGYLQKLVAALIKLTDEPNPPACTSFNGC